MADRQYWLDLFSGTTWKEFLEAGGTTSGFQEGRWATIRKMKPGDFLICYLTGVSRFIGILEVVSEPFLEKTHIWKDALFPARVHVKPVVILSPETAIPVQEFFDKLTFLKNLSGPHKWTGYFRGSPALWKREDGETILNALIATKEDPIFRQVDPKKLAKRPQRLVSKNIGLVSIPEGDNEPNLQKELFSVNEKSAVNLELKPIENRKHTEIEYILLNLGHEMGFNVWVARNDRNREYQSHKFVEYFKIKGNLPLQFDDATMRTVELIDVLWLKGNAIVSAFEVESTTSIYSGLLRMSDLISMQPNINIPLYLVAPEERRRKVFEEINRATFSRLNPPLAKVCRYIAFETLIERVQKVQGIVKYLKPEFLAELSEDCDK